MDEAVTDLERVKEVDVKDIILTAIEALESIADYGHASDTEEYWLKDTTHENCAEVLAMDTYLARTALEKIAEKIP